MYHMVWHFRYPYFRFPRKFFRKPFISFKIKKCCYKYLTCLNTFRHFCNFQYTLGSIGPTEVTDSIKYTQFLSSRYNTTSGILSCNVISNPSSVNFSTFFTKSFSIVSPTYRHSEFGANLGANSSIIAFCFC